MFTQVVISLGMMITAAPAQAAGAVETKPSSATDVSGEIETGAPVDQQEFCCRCKGLRLSTYFHSWAGHCNMPQHYPYGATRGYYYFRPYHEAHLRLHQEMAEQWGGDPRNPYDNDALFDAIQNQPNFDESDLESEPLPLPENENQSAERPPSMPKATPAGYQPFGLWKIRRPD